MDFVSLAGLIAIIATATALLVNMSKLEEYFWKRRERREQLKQRELALRGPKDISNNLPARTSFIGREKNKEELYAALVSSYPVIAIEGLGGIGKTALARAVSWELQKGEIAYGTTPKIPKFESIIWTEDTGGKGNLVLDEVLDSISTVLKYPGIKQLPIEKKIEETKKLLEMNPSLVIIDNFESIQDHRIQDFVTSIPWPPSKALITTREKRIRPVVPVPLGRMEYADAKQLILSTINGLKNASEETLTAFYKAAGGNPYVFKTAGALIDDPGHDLEGVMKLLSTGENEEIFDHIFIHNWEVSLKDFANAKDILYAMTLFASAVTTEALEDVSLIKHAFFREAIERLDGLSMIETRYNRDTSIKGYELHTLTRAFVKGKLESNSSLEVEFQKRFVDHYIKSGEKWSDTWIDAENIDDQEREKENIYEAARLAYQFAKPKGEKNYWNKVISFANNQYPFLWGRGYWNELEIFCSRAVEGAKILNRIPEEAIMWARIGRIHVWRGSNYPEAINCLEKISKALAGVTDQKILAIPKRLEAQIATAKEEFDKAEGLLEEVLLFAPNTPDDDGRAATLIELGTVAIGKKQYQVAQNRFKEALTLDEASGTQEGQAVSLSFLARATYELDDMADARQYYESAMALAESVGRAITKADCQMGLGRIYSKLGQYEKARELLTDAIANYESLRAPMRLGEAKSLLEKIRGGRK
jgi:tetratricopeptide (TPR) repeat protein